MCGRFTLTADLADVLNTFSVDSKNYEYTTRYNIAPSQTISVITNCNGHRALEGYRWGLVLRWAKDIKIGFKIINARAETLKTKPAYRNYCPGIKLSFLQTILLLKVNKIISLTENI
ncbi:hypothetical protein D3C74_101430 [compost metagenome]